MVQELLRQFGGRVEGDRPLDEAMARPEPVFLTNADLVDEAFDIPDDWQLKVQQRGTGIPSTLITALFALLSSDIPIPPLSGGPPLASVDTLSSSALSLVITKSLPEPLTLEVRTNFDSVPVFIIFAVTPKLSSESLIA
ncbi:hypothetical protein LCGC14_3007530, partial [marine sediment metagenome]